MPLASFWAVTFTPLSTAPLESATRPKIRPPVLWAKECVDTTNKQITTAATADIRDILCDGIRVPPNIWGSIVGFNTACTKH
jgi:hypothetical protein